jgi:hypothetical protein
MTPYGKSPNITAFIILRARVDERLCHRSEIRKPPCSLEAHVHEQGKDSKVLVQRAYSTFYRFLTVGHGVNFVKALTELFIYFVLSESKRHVITREFG